MSLVSIVSNFKQHMLAMSQVLRVEPLKELFILHIRVAFFLK